MAVDPDTRVQRTTVSGVPVFYGESPLPFTAALVFRVGRVDETLRSAGVTHLVEHLALPPGRVRGLDYNGTVDGTTTILWAAAPRDQALEFLFDVCAALTDLPLDRLERERGILLTEASGAGMGNVGFAAAMRYGPHGYGLVGHDELGLHHLGREEAAAWSAERFTLANVALCLTGEPPDELDLGLPPGTLVDAPATQAIPYLEFPSAFGKAMPGRVSLAVESRRSHEITTGLSIAAERLRNRLRYRSGFTYEVDSWYEPTSRDTAHAVLSADCLDENVDSVRSGLLTVLSDLADRGPTAEELEHELDEMRRMTEDPHSLTSGLLYGASAELGGDGFRTDAELMAEREEVTSAGVAAALTAALDTMLLLIPEGAALPGGRFKPFPTRSPVEVRGRRYRRKGLRLPFRAGETLVAGEDGVAFEAGETRNAVRFDGCLAVMTWQTGERGLWGTDGFYVFVDPRDWRGGKELTELVDRNAGEGLRIPMDEFEPAASDPVLLRGLDLADDPAKAAEAIPLLQEGLEREPEAAAGWAALASCLMDERRHGEALRAAERAVELAPDVEVAHRVLAYALWHTHRRDEAADAIMPALDLEPADAQTLADFAWFLGEVSRFDDAARAAERAVELFPEHGSSWFARGWVALQRGEWEDAERDLRKAIELAPEDSMWHNNLGWLLLKTGRPEEADREFRRALSLDRRNPFAEWNRTIALRLQGKHKEAAELRRKIAEKDLEIYRRAAEADPRDASARSGLAHRLHDLGRHDEALEQARLAAEASTDAGPLLELGAWLADLGRIEEAREAIRRGAERGPDDPLTLYYRAWLGAAAGDAEDAAEAVAAARERNEDDLRAWLASGYAEIAAERWPEARRWFERTQRRDPIHCCAHVWNGVALARLGEREAAEGELERGAVLNPGCECAGVQRLRRELDSTG